MYTINQLILIIVLLGACSPNRQIVYFKDPGHKIQEDKMHRHGVLPSPHYEPIIDHPHTFYIIQHYDTMYKMKHSQYGSKERKKANYWLYTYLLLTFITLL